MTRVLVIVDEPDLLAALCVVLHGQGFDIAVPADARLAATQVAGLRPDLVVADLRAGPAGYGIISGLRAQTGVPIVALSKEDSNTGQVAALEAGADQFVTRPFTVEELVAHIRAMARRMASVRTGPTVRIGRYLIDVDAHQVRTGEQAGEQTAGRTPPRLTPTEWRVLEVLLRNPDRLVSPWELRAGVGRAGRSAGYFRQYLAQLRRKLEPEPSRPRYFLTKPGEGYLFRPGGSGPSSARPAQGSKR